MTSILIISDDIMEEFYRHAGMAPFAGTREACAYEIATTRSYHLQRTRL